MALFENFPYTNLHELNLDWIIKIAKDFLEQYTNIQQLIEEGETSLVNLKETGLEELQEKADTLEAALQAWYDTHSEDIAQELASALADLNAWYTNHQNYLDAILAENETAFTDYINQKTAEVIQNIPQDYSELSKLATDTRNELVDQNVININTVYKTGTGSIDGSGQIITNNSFKLSYANITGMDNIKVTGGHLYGWYATDPTYGSVAVDSARHEDTLNGTILIKPAAANYIVIRSNTNEMVTVTATTSTVNEKLLEMEEDAFYFFDLDDTTMNGSINAAGQLITGNFMIHIFKTDELSKIQITGGDLYAWYDHFPVSITDYAMDETRHEATLNKTVLPILSGSKCIAVRTAINGSCQARNGNNTIILKAIGEFNNDANELPTNTFINVNQGIFTKENNHVPVDGFVGTIFTFCGVPDQTVIKGQIAVAEGPNPFIFFRSYYTSWRDWKTVETAENLSAQLPVLTAFSNITCCGDSLTFGQVYTGAATSRQAYNPYPRVIEKETGTPTVQFARPGYTAANWWNAYAGDIVAKENQLAIIYLGTNGGLTDTLANDAPANTDPATWANNNTGCYAKIVQKFKDVGARVLLVKCYASTNLETTNSVIQQIAERFGCAYIENKELTDLKYHYYPNLSGSNSPHYNDLGYSAFAHYLINQVASLPEAIAKYIIPA